MECRRQLRSGRSVRHTVATQTAAVVLVMTGRAANLPQCCHQTVTVTVIGRCFSGSSHLRAVNTLLSLVFAVDVSEVN